MSYKAGFVGLIGQPNAGKSTLLNTLVKEKLSIVTAKPQTTRRRVLGLVSKTEGQIVFVDAPGLLHSTSGLNSFLEQEAQDVIAQSDVLIAVLNLDEKEKSGIEKTLKLVAESKKPWITVITKTDLQAFKHRIVMVKDLITQKKNCLAIFECGKGEVIEEDIFKKCLELLPEAPAALYDPEDLTPHTVRDLCEEVIRERCFENVHQEIPYQLAVRIRKFDEENPKLVKISADILVAKQTHKPIVIGKGGSIIKAIGTEARKEIEKWTGGKVHLELEVVVKEDWYQNSQIMKELGYVVQD